jgi:hypothetical protein
MKPEAVVKTAEFHSCGVERRLWLTRDILARPATDERLSQALQTTWLQAIADRYLVVGSVIHILRSSNISGLFYCGGIF